MLSQNCELSVLVKNRPIKQFVHEDQYFVEGRGGSAYELEFVNHNPFRVEVVLSVDGLSVTDGRPAGPASTGYLVTANGGRLRVPGWTLDRAAVAAFTFASEAGGSYAEQSGRSGVNKGVIGALVYQEKPQMPVLRPVGSLLLEPQLWPYHSVSAPAYPYWQFGMTLNNAAPASVRAPFVGVSTSQSAASTNNAIASSAGLAASAHEPMTHTTAQSTTAQSTTAQSVTAQSLGTGFGEATQFQTEPVTFRRGDMVVVMALYYDDMRGLKARGVPVSQPRRTFTIPQAFPALTNACVPPAGWSSTGRRR